MRASRVIAVSVAAAVAALGFAAPGVAAADGRSTGGTSTVPASAAQPEVSIEEYLDTLTPAERTYVEQNLLPVSEEITTLPARPADARAALSVLQGNVPDAGAITARAVGCWTGRSNGSQKAALGNTLYTYYTVVRWCSNGSTVTSASLADAGGETSTPGWRYDGVTASGGGVVAGTGRAYASHKFIYRAGFWDVQNVDKCLRVIGTVAGTSSGNATCGIY